MVCRMWSVPEIVGCLRIPVMFVTPSLFGDSGYSKGDISGEQGSHLQFRGYLLIKLRQKHLRTVPGFARYSPPLRIMTGTSGVEAIFSTRFS